MNNPEGYVLVQVKQLAQWREWANNVAAWSTKADRSSEVARLKASISSAMISATQPTARPEQAEAPTFTVEDADLNALLNAAHWMHQPGANMDNGVEFLDALERVQLRLATQPTASNAGERTEQLVRPLPETMTRDEMLKYYSSYANLCAHEALEYQKRIRDLEAALATKPPAGEQKPTAQQIADYLRGLDGMVSVKAEDANNYCRVLTALGMEEEGDPVAAIEDLKAAVHDAEEAALQPEQVAQDSERVRLLTEVETTGEGLRYSLDCLVNNGVNTFRVCDEEENEYLGDGWVLDPVQAIDDAIRAARARGEGKP